MPRSNPRRKAPLLVGLISLAALGGGLLASGQDGRAREVALGAMPQADLPAAWRKAESCGICHREITPKDREVLPRLGELATFVLFSEYATWAKQDVHHLAFTVLKSTRARQMKDRLEYDVTEDRRCLACHGPGPADAAHGKAIKEEGVTCVACHGAAGTWADEHPKDFPTWVGLPAATKSNQYGMTDLRDPVARARVCVSCHVGNAAEGRLITHDMYAAGHPPLSGWESSSWARGMHPHWLSTKDVPYLQKPDQKIQKNYHFEDAGFEQTRHTLAGGVVVFAESLRLLSAHLSARTAPAPPVGPEFARYDCRACHHDLKREPEQLSWRQARGFPTGPGRPPLPAWTLVLVPLALDAVAKDAAGRDARAKKFWDGLKDLDQALGDRPFGNPQSAAEKALSLAGWTDKIAAELGTTRMDRTKAITLLRRLCDQGICEPYDFDAARQVAWAFEAIYGDLVPRGSEDSAVKPIFDVWKSGMKTGLKTELPHWTDTNDRGSLAAYLSLGAEFEPAAFQNQLRQILGAIPAR